MDKDIFEETENKVFKYFNRDKMTKSLNEKLKILDKQIESIENDLRKCNVSIEEESSSPSFEQKVQTSGTGISYAEREVMRVTELQTKRILSKQLERQKVLEQLDDIEIACNEIGWKIEEFEGELKDILKFLYKDRLGENAIAEKMNIGQPQINKRKQQMIRKIALWDGWNIEKMVE